MIRTVILLTLFASASGLMAQSGEGGRSYQRVRATQRSYDLPYITVKTLTPRVAADQAILVLYSPDSMWLTLRIEAWMEEGNDLWQQRVSIGPGRQEILVPLYALQEGRYTLLVDRRRQTVGTQALAVVR
jgi:hypothetical protein